MKEICHKDAALPILAIVDSRGLVDSAHSTKSVDDKRLRIDIAAIKEFLQKGEINSIRWCPGGLQLSNCMTKKGASGSTLLELLQSGSIDLERYNILD